MKRPKTVLCVIIAILLLLLFSSILPVYTLKSFHSDTTASSKSWIAWPFGIKRNYEYKESALESHLKQHYSEEIDYQWVSSRGTGKNIYGQVVIRAHGRPNQLLTYPDDFLEMWITEATNEQIESFYLTLKNENEEEIESAINGLFEQVDELLKTKWQNHSH